MPEGTRCPGSDTEWRQGSRFSEACWGCQFFGPRGSLALTSLQGPVVLFGDETSFAVAHALRNLRAGAEGIEQVFEVSSRGGSETVLREFHLSESAVVERAPDEGWRSVWASH